MQSFRFDAMRLPTEIENLRAEVRAFLTEEQHAGAFENLGVTDLFVCGSGGRRFGVTNPD